MIKERLIDYIRDSITGNWDIEALGDYQGKSYSYRDIAGSILKIHMLFKEAGIEEGDKIALLGKNSANWCTVYLATVTYGAVTVPILPDFKRDDLMNILNHSDSKMLFVDEKIWETLAYNDLKEISNVIKLESFSYLDGRDNKCKALNERLSEAFNEKYPELKK
jgi:long-chain acyl-CoA synthetase